MQGYIRLSFTGVNACYADFQPGFSRAGKVSLSLTGID
jgi:hypothetical protein